MLLSFEMYPGCTTSVLLGARETAGVVPENGCGAHDQGDCILVVPFDGCGVRIAVVGRVRNDGECFSQCREPSLFVEVRIAANDLYDVVGALILANGVGEALQSSQATTLESWFDENDADWATEGAPYYFGLFSWFDGTPIVADFQNHYGRAYAVDADMNILLEEAGGSLLSTEQVGEGSDGWYEIYAFTWLSVSEDLP